MCVKVYGLLGGDALIKSFNGKSPIVASSAFISRTALVCGDVVIGKHSGIWPGAIIRGDYSRISIGNRSYVEDGCILHTGEVALEIADDVLMGHGAVVHCRWVGRGALIAMNATLLMDAEIGEFSTIAAGAVVTEGMKIPPYSLVTGVPARVTGRVPEEEVQQRLKEYGDYMVRVMEMLKAGDF